MLAEREYSVSTGEVVEVHGEYIAYSTGWPGLLDANCVRITSGPEGFYATAYGRTAGEEYEDPRYGPFSTLREARLVAQRILEAAE